MFDAGTGKKKVTLITIHYKKVSKSVSNVRCHVLVSTTETMNAFKSLHCLSYLLYLEPDRFIGMQILFADMS